MAKRRSFFLGHFSLIYQNQNEILDRFCSYCCCKLCCFTTRTNFRTKTNRWMAKRQRYGRYGKEIQSNPSSTDWLRKDWIEFLSHSAHIFAVLPSTDWFWSENWFWL